MASNKVTAKGRKLSKGDRRRQRALNAATRASKAESHEHKQARVGGDLDESTERPWLSLDGVPIGPGCAETASEAADRLSRAEGAPGVKPSSRR